MLYRKELDLVTGKERVIPQLIYRLPDSIIVVLDAGQLPPEGAVEISLEDLEEGTSNEQQS